MTDERVRSVEVAGDRLYLGGDFEYIGPPTGAAAIVNDATGNLKPQSVAFEGSVEAAVSDGNGGWFIGGDQIHTSAGYMYT